MDKLFSRVPIKLPIEIDKKAPGDDVEAAEDDADDLKSIAGPTCEVDADAESIED